MVSSELYPFKSHFYDNLGHKQHYLDEGQGPVVVMVHGNPTWSFYFRNLVLALRGSFRVIVPDHIGCGYSDKPDDQSYPYRVTRRVEDLERLLEQLELKGPIHLVVHDWGGMIGFGYATRHPERIGKLVVLNTAAFPLPSDKKFPTALWWGRNTALGAFLIRGLNAFCRVAARECVKAHPLPAPVRAAYLQPYDSWANRIAVLRFVQDIPLRPSDPSWPEVAQTADRLSLLSLKPMLICWGLRDFVFSGEFLNEWVRRFPAAEVRRFEDRGHYILEDAREEVIPRIAAFLQEP